MNKHRNYLKGFVSGESHDFKFQIGKILASSLSGFMAGVIAASIFWLIEIIFLFK